MFLLRYLSQDYGIKSIISGEFKVARPLDVNDPYEMMGACVGQLRDEVRTEVLNEMRYEWVKRGLDFPPKRRVVSIEEVERSINRIADYFQMVLMERQAQQRKNRILCFVDASKINETSDQLMWGHYAKNGTGMRVWFDSDVLSDTGMPPIFPIEYDSKRPTLDLSKDLSKLKSFNDHEVWDSFIRKLWLTKSCAWEYEHEWRMLVPHNDARVQIVERAGFEFVKLPIASIVRVDFGPKGFIEESKEIVREWRRDERTKHIDFRVTTFSDTDYKYDYLQYDGVS